MLKRFCPQCNSELSYKNKCSFSKAVRENNPCRSCTVKNEYKINPDKNRGDKNGMYGKNLKNLMIEKYGEDQGEINYEKWKSNLYRFGLGELNPQYGNSPFKNGGRSYHGWYKGIFFRSSFELIFLSENWGLDLISADNKKFRVEYTNNGKRCFYYPDFYSKKKNTIYEIKPKKWILDEKNILKIESAKKNLGKLGYGFCVVTEDDLDYLKGSTNNRKNTDHLTYCFIVEKLMNGEIELTEASLKRLKNKAEKRREFLKLEKLKIYG